MREIAVIFERTVYAMTLGAINVPLGREEYVVTLPADIPKEKLKQTISTVLASLEQLAIKNRDHDLRPVDTWGYRIAPVRFPMEAYPAPETEDIIDANGTEAKAE